MIWPIKDNMYEGFGDVFVAVMAMYLFNNCAKSSDCFYYCYNERQLI